MRLHEELKRADAIVLTYACDQPMTLNRLTTFWLQEIRKLEVLYFHIDLFLKSMRTSVMALKVVPLFLFVFTI